MKIYLNSYTKQIQKKKKKNMSDTCDVEGAMDLNDLLGVIRGPLSLSLKPELVEDPERYRAYTLIYVMSKQFSPKGFLKLKDCRSV